MTAIDVFVFWWFQNNSKNKNQSLQQKIDFWNFKNIIDCLIMIQETKIK